MSQEITISTAITVKKGTLTDKWSERFKANLAGSLSKGEIAPIGTSTHQALITSSITTAGYFVGKNLDTTNNVTIGRDTSGTFVPFCIIKPGETQMFRPSTSALYAKATTAAVHLQYRLFDD